MTIEKAFAIKAAPHDIWAALQRELNLGDASAFTVETSQPPERLQVLVHLGAMPARLTYKITPREGDTEVSVDLEPLAKRYWLYQLVTFGHMKRNYEMLLVEGLANLKDAVEEPELESEPAAAGDLS